MVVLGLGHHAFDELRLFVEVRRGLDLEVVLHADVRVVVDGRGGVPRAGNAETLVDAVLEDGEAAEQHGLAAAVLEGGDLVREVPAVSAVGDVALEEHLGELVAVAVPVEHGVLELKRYEHGFGGVFAQEAVHVLQNALELVRAREPHGELSVDDDQVVDPLAPGHVVFRDPQVEVPHAVGQLLLDGGALAAHRRRRQPEAGARVVCARDGQAGHVHVVVHACHPIFRRRLFHGCFGVCVCVSWCWLSRPKPDSNPIMSRLHIAAQKDAPRPRRHQLRLPLLPMPLSAFPALPALSGLCLQHLCPGHQTNRNAARVPDGVPSRGPHKAWVGSVPDGSVGLSGWLAGAGCINCRGEYYTGRGCGAAGRPHLDVHACGRRGGLDGLDEEGFAGGGVDGQRAVCVRDGPRLREKAHVCEDADEHRVGAVDDGRARGNVALRTQGQGVAHQLGLDVEVVGIGVEDAEEGDVERHGRLVHDSVEHEHADGDLAEVRVATELAAVPALLDVVVRVLGGGGDSVEDAEVVGGEAVELDGDGGGRHAGWRAALPAARRPRGQGRRGCGGRRKVLIFLQAHGRRDRRFARFMLRERGEGKSIYQQRRQAAAGQSPGPAQASRHKDTCP